MRKDDNNAAIDAVIHAESAEFGPIEEKGET